MSRIRRGPLVGGRPRQLAPTSRYLLAIPVYLFFIHGLVVVLLADAGHVLKVNEYPIQPTGGEEPAEERVRGGVRPGDGAQAGG